MDKTKLTGHGFNIMHLKERSQERQMRMCTLTLAFAGQRRGADHTHTRCPSSAIRVVSCLCAQVPRRCVPTPPAFGYGTKSSCAMFVASVSAEQISHLGSGMLATGTKPKPCETSTVLGQKDVLRNNGCTRSTEH